MIPTRVVVRVRTGEWLSWMERLAGMTARAALFFLGLIAVVLLVLGVAHFRISLG
ncbi:MAG: hypothetical protein ACKV22_07950 [Bryobacteraceae bacterium]